MPRSRLAAVLPLPLAAVSVGLRDAGAPRCQRDKQAARSVLVQGGIPEAALQCPQVAGRMAQQCNRATPNGLASHNFANGGIA